MHDPGSASRGPVLDPAGKEFIMRIDRWTEHWGPWRSVIVLIVGVAISFAVMFALTGIMSTIASAALVLAGIALTFAVLGLLPIETGETRWALGPAAVASVFAWMLMVEATGLPIIMRAVWPIILIAFFAWEYAQVRDQGHGSLPAPHA
jgi:hypothetical protein